MLLQRRKNNDDHRSFISNYRVANSTPIVLLLSRLNSFRVKRESKLLFPTPESPINTTKTKVIILVSHLCLSMCTFKQVIVFVLSSHFDLNLKKSKVPCRFQIRLYILLDVTYRFSKISLVHKLLIHILTHHGLSGRRRLRKMEMTLDDKHSNSKET